MANYIFEQLALSQGEALVGNDTVTFTAAGAWATTVVYLTPSIVEITSNGHTVDFLANQITAMTVGGYLQFSDGSRIFIGDSFNNQAQFFKDSPGSALFGGGGDDTLSSWGFHSLIQGNSGDDSLTDSGAANTIYGGQGDDVISMDGGASFAQANKGADTIHGSSQGADTILGGQGDDSISGSGLLDGNLGDDRLSGSGQLLGEGGNDTLIASAASGVVSTLSGGDGNDSLAAGVGANSITGDAGADTISITGGTDTISGGAGGDRFVFGTISTASATGVPQVVDWSGGEDQVSFLGYTANAADFTTATAADFASAVSAATSLTTQQHFSFVAVQVGSDVFLFAGGSGGLTSAVDLVGRSLSDIAGHNLV